MLKKLFLSLAIFILSAPIVSAIGQTPAGNKITPDQKDAITQKQPQAEDKINQNYDAFKAALLKRIDRAISMIDATTQKILGNAKISEASKQAIIASLANAKKGLEDYRVKAEKSTSLDELKAINQEVIKYLQNNKDVIKKSVQDALSVIGGEVAKKTEAYKEKLAATLAILKKTCPTEAAAITNLEKKLTELDGEIKALKQATQTKNSAEIKKVTAEIKTTMKDISTTLKSLEGKCQL